MFILQREQRLFPPAPQFFSDINLSLINMQAVYDRSFWLSYRINIFAKEAPCVLRSFHVPFFFLFLATTYSLVADGLFYRFFTAIYTHSSSNVCIINALLIPDVLIKYKQYVL